MSKDAQYASRFAEIQSRLGLSNNKMGEAMGTSGKSYAGYLSGVVPGVDKVGNLIRTYPEVNFMWIVAGKEPVLFDHTTEKPFESNESRTNPLTDEEGYKKLELQIAQIRRELISAQAEIAGNRKYIDQLDAYRESQLRNAKQDVMDVESGLEALNEKISQRNNRAEQGI